MLKAAGAWLLQGRIGEVFDAFVTGAAAKGTFVRISRPLLEGRVVRGFDGLEVGDTASVSWWRWMPKGALSTSNAPERCARRDGRNVTPSEKPLHSAPQVLLGLDTVPPGNR